MVPTIDTGRAANAHRLTHAHRARLNYRVDLFALATASVAFASGLVLLLEFHVGPEGATRHAGAGLSRLAWVNIHRSAAVALAAALAIHAALHWRGVALRLRAPRTSRAPLADLLLYLGFAVVALAAFAAWLIVPGSPPLRGALAAGPPPGLRHAVIDVHNLSGMVALGAALVHLRRHLGWIVRNSRAGTPRGAKACK